MVRPTIPVGGRLARLVGGPQLFDEPLIDQLELENGGDDE